MALLLRISQAETSSVSDTCISRSALSVLPSPRSVSTNFHPGVDVDSATATLMLMQFGQFLDHDLTLTPETELEEGDCCGRKILNSVHDHEEEEEDVCLAIQVPWGDRFNRTCMDFTRSTAFCQETLGYREQMNGITAFIDASNVYGSDDETAAMLRTFEGGKLKVDWIEGQEYLPQIDGEQKAGDERVLEMPGLAAMHTLFLREHNRLAGQVQADDPQLQDEEVYHEARKIVIAEMQNIVFAEFLPAVLGRETTERWGLDVAERNTTYNNVVDASIINSFATAAFRFGHSLIQGRIGMKDLDSGQLKYYHLRDQFFSTDKYFDDAGRGWQEILNGIAEQPSQEGDNFVTVDVTNFQQVKKGGERTDLVSRNIQRGRDHGLPGYNAFRKACGLRPICSWRSTPTEMPKEKWLQLSELYSRPGDIDLFSGGLAETPPSDGVVGPTFGCILATQFWRLMEGDRFFYTHWNGAGGLSGEQLDYVRGRTLAKVICDNTDINRIPASVFNLHSQIISC